MSAQSAFADRTNGEASARRSEPRLAHAGVWSKPKVAIAVTGGESARFRPLRGQL
jgi:hypothetical protein